MERAHRLGRKLAPDGALRGFFEVTRRVPGRATNLVLLLALLVVFATGIGAVATGSARGAWVIIGHGVAGLAILLLTPWKGRIVRHGLRRARPSRWLSLLFAGLTLGAIGLGVAHTTGVRSIGNVPAMWLHVVVALALAPLAIWHVLARQSRPRRTDLSRRNLLRVAFLTVGAAGVYTLAATVERVVSLPGSRRRFTGSYPVGSLDPPAMPATIWLADRVPLLDGGRWRLTVVDGLGSQQFGLADLERRATTRRALLDCTSGWYAEQDWTCVPVTDLLRGIQGDARSLLVHSVTGYWVRYPMSDLGTLFLATAAGGAPLSPGHGYPLRLVAPGRRGYWWVKWVDRIEVQTTPPWWQPPFPIT